MKTTATAFFGAMLVTTGWVGVPAFAEQRPAGTQVDTAAASAKSAPQAKTCNAGTHAHASSCGCARCTAARTE
jgi:hypothetical protein